MLVSYSWKLLLEKTFVKKLSLPIVPPKDVTPPNFMEKTFVNSNKTSKFAKVFSLESVPLYGTTHAEEFSWTIELTNWPSGTMSIKLHVHVSRQANISQGTPRTVSVTWAKHYNGAFCHTSVIRTFQLSEHPPVPTCSDKWLPTVLSSCHSYSYKPVQLSRALFPLTFLWRLPQQECSRVHVYIHVCAFLGWVWPLVGASLTPRQGFAVWIWSQSTDFWSVQNRTSSSNF